MITDICCYKRKELYKSNYICNHAGFEQCSTRKREQNRLYNGRIYSFHTRGPKQKWLLFMLWGKKDRKRFHEGEKKEFIHHCLQ